ncbi:MAG: radical SAM protein [Candidatus Nanoarchaeia archaeon]|nr:radical SAM protein [Candidatus Nanoarchaeia archaeon]
MKILLIQPEATKAVNKEFLSLQYPINLGYIASSLIKANNEVKMIDLNVMPKKELLKIIKKFKPQIAGLTSMTSSIYNAGETIDIIKDKNKKIITVLGGCHASALPFETMKEIKNLDFLVHGEGEETVVELVDFIKKGKKMHNIPGIAFREKNGIIINKKRELIKDLDSIPFPNRDLIDMELYSKHHVTRGFSRKNNKIIEILTSRGCPNKCIFCAGHVNYKGTLRFRSFENIKKEIEENIEKFNINHISIEDDTFTINRPLVIKLCEFFKEKKLSWNCNSRVNTVNLKLLKMMAESGCKKISFGVESGSPKILKKIKKNIRIKDVKNAVKNAKKAGIRFVECTFMIGSHPDEKIEDVEKSIKLMHELMPDFLAFSILCPFPGTEIYDILIKSKLLPKNPDWSQFSLFGNLKRYEKLNYMTSDEMIKLQSSVLKNYYKSPKYVWNQIKKIKSFDEVKYFLSMAKSYLKELVFAKN